jgi:hypothetical protein
LPPTLLAPSLPVEPYASGLAAVEPAGEGELYVRLLRRALERVESLAGRFRLLGSYGGRLLDLLEAEGLLHRLEGVSWDFRSVGVDGSRQILRGVMGRHYVFLDVAVVEVEPGGRGFRVAYPVADVVEVEDPTGSSVDTVAEYAMLLGETQTIAGLRCESGVVMLDGPIVDPPGPLDAELASRAFSQMLGVGLGEARRLAEEYHERRARAIAGLGCPVVGVVKRVSSHTLLASLAARAGARLPQGVSDGDLAAALAAAARERGLSLFAVGPGDACEAMEGGVASAYCTGGLRVYYAYTFAPRTMKPYRVEVLAGEPGEALRAAAYAQAATLPGHSLPLPVLLAHEKSTIRRSTVKLIYREMLARLTRPDEDAASNTLKALTLLWGEG